jgi:outer membrane protein assembly factor BamE (lipoprotein component of BamABCDE complex)
MKKYILLLSVVFILVACEAWLPEAYKYPISQGNTINEFQLQQIHTGMDIKELEKILGTPLLYENKQKTSLIYHSYETKSGTQPEKMIEYKLLINKDKLQSVDKRMINLR